jgi:hypothetical protein
VKLEWTKSKLCEFCEICLVDNYKYERGNWNYGEMYVNFSFVMYNW